MVFTIEEKTCCVVWFATSKSVTGVQRQFRAHFHKHGNGKASVPGKNQIKAWHDKFMTRGDIHRNKRTNIKWVRTDAAVNEVITRIRNDGHRSARSIAREDALPSLRSVLRILKEAKFHAYKMQLHQELKTIHSAKRREFCHAQLQLIATDPHFIHRILFSDEAHFSLHGSVNHQNFRYWSDSNPNWYREEPLHSPRLTVWAAMGHHGVVGPIFIEGNVTGTSYLSLLQQHFLPAVQEWPSFAEVIFMQDGAPPHWAIPVRNWLTLTFPGRWIGRGSPNMFWPPNSPDLTPCDFFLWGYLKSRVYHTQPADLDELRTRIEHEFAVMPQDMMQRSIDSYQRRLQKCITVNGRSVE
jgi:hypothetical protein